MDSHIVMQFVSELGAVLDALPKKHKELYNKLNSTGQNLFQKKIRSAYGQDLEKVSFSISMKASETQVMVPPSSPRPWW